MSMPCTDPANMPLVITLYEEIREGAAERVLHQLNAAPSTPVEVRLNSPGGLVMEGLAIYNALRTRKPTVYIDGVAASIASVIAMAGARIVAAANSLVMIHDPWVTATGDPAELRRKADMLDKHLDAVITAYARTRLPAKQLREMCAAETWMTADEALALGFVDEISEALQFAAHAPECYARYLNPPERLMPKAAENTPLTDAAPDPISDLRHRNDWIASVGDGHMEEPAIRSLVINSLRDPAVTLESFNQQFMMLSAQGRGPLGGAATIDAAARTGVGGSDFVQAAADALAIQSGVKIENPHPGARDVAGMGLRGIVRACVQRGGRDGELGMNASHGTMVKAALSTGDFPLILSNTLGKVLRAGFETEPSTHEAWTRQVLVPDFKLQSRPILGSAPALELVLEGGEYTLGAIDEDRSVPYKVDKFGRLVRFTWEALINDDLGAFTRIVQALGQAAARCEADQIYASFKENSGAGPTMQDTKALFHTDHGNLASSSVSLDAAALGAARTLLRRQKAVGGGAMNLAPRFLLVAPEHEQAAEVLLAAAARSLSQGSDNALVPAWLARLELVVEARLADDAFWLLAHPDQVDTVERAWLEADNGPRIEEEDSFGIDARTYKVRHVFGSRWLDYRGAVKVPLSGS